MNKKVIVNIFLTIICMLTIFSFSSKDTNNSNNTSKKIIYKVVSIYEKVFNKDLDEDQLVTRLNYPIRKLAHYSIYFLLGIFIYQICINLNIKYKGLLTLLICIVYAITDETHQLFVSGRTGQILDVFIDTLGSLTAILLVKLISFRTMIKKS